jgi:hypothetical protein
MEMDRVDLWPDTVLYEEAMSKKGKKPVGGDKGSSFERKMCKRLSLWWTDGERNDVFWRGKGSGSRFTQGGGSRHTSGDMVADDPIGQPLVNWFNFEFKHYRDFNLFEAVEPPTKTGKVRRFWAQTCTDAEKADKEPILICKRDLRDPYLFIHKRFRHLLAGTGSPKVRYVLWDDIMICQLFPFLETVDPESFIAYATKRRERAC